jgi:hypothetical protein
MFGNFDYKKGFFLRFFNELINVDNIDNKFFFQFFFFKTYGVRLQFFFGFVRNWLKLSYKLYYNYIRLRDIACFREVAFKKLYLDFVVIRKLHFDQKVSFHPNNNQKYIRSNVWNNAFTLSKRKCVVSGGKGRNFYLGPRNLSGKDKVFTKRLSKRFKSLSYGFSGNFDFSKYKFFDNHFLFLRK